jgi:hypothetical protein
VLAEDSQTQHRCSALRGWLVSAGKAVAEHAGSYAFLNSISPEKGNAAGLSAPAICRTLATPFGFVPRCRGAAMDCRAPVPLVAPTTCRPKGPTRGRRRENYHVTFRTEDQPDAAPRGQFTGFLSGANKFFLRASLILPGSRLVVRRSISRGTDKRQRVQPELQRGVSRTLGLA